MESYHLLDSIQAGYNIISQALAESSRPPNLQSSLSAIVNLLHHQDSGAQEANLTAFNSLMGARNSPLRQQSWANVGVLAQESHGYPNPNYYPFAGTMAPDMPYMPLASINELGLLLQQGLQPVALPLPAMER